MKKMLNLAVLKKKKVELEQEDLKYIKGGEGICDCYEPCGKSKNWLFTQAVATIHWGTDDDDKGTPPDKDIEFPDVGLCEACGSPFVYYGIFF